ncbi:MAG: sugar transferase [Christensenellales bacterium]|jgi:O-antigen biosynthesis protein WbqP
MDIYRYLKRFFDLLFSGIGLLLLAPLFLVVAIIIACDSKGPVFFVHQRMGRDGVPFNIYKFRTMVQEAPKDMATSQFHKAEDFITRPGKWLRRLSIDELPQLINVFKGDMSLIGPRPVVLTEKNLIRIRHELGADRVLPGLSGWAQVHGRDDVDYRAKAKLDAYYAQHIGFVIDLKIFFMTIWYVLTGKGIREGSSGDDSAAVTAPLMSAPETEETEETEDQDRQPVQRRMQPVLETNDPKH